VKFVPFTVSVKAGPPAVAEFGFKLVIVGRELIVKVAPAEVTPDSVTVMVTVPAAAIRLAGTAAVT
jgi:hypothetical protein